MVCKQYKKGLQAIHGLSRSSDRPRRISKMLSDGGHKIFGKTIAGQVSYFLNWLISVR